MREEQSGEGVEGRLGEILSGHRRADGCRGQRQH